MGRGPDDGDEPDPPRSGGRDKRVYYAQESAAPPRPVSKPRDGYDTPARSPYPPADRGRAYGDGRGDGGGQAPPPRFPSRPPGVPSRPPRRRRGGPRIGRILLVLLVVLLVGTGVLYVVFDGKLQRTEALPDYQGRPEGGRGTNWLIVGSDSREGLSEAERDRLGTGFAAGRRTDTVMILHVPRPGGPTTLVSLPRDSYVPIPGRGSNKLNAAFAFGGPKLLARTVEQATGLRMDHYMEIGFGGFAGLVDAVGGVTMCIDKPVKDSDAGLNIKKAGCQELDSKQALAYVRSRKAFAGGDLDRAKHQREFIGALIKKATSPAVFLNPFKSVPLANAGAGALIVNEGDHLHHLVRLAFAMKALSGDKGTTTSVPVAGNASRAGAGSVVLWDDDRAAALFKALNNDQPLTGIIDEPDEKRAG
jgi:LCP family protein required for cell wall assembly